MRKYLIYIVINLMILFAIGFFEKSYATEIKRVTDSTGYWYEIDGVKVTQIAYYATGDSIMIVQWLVLTSQSLEELKNDNIPEDILNLLNKLKDKKYASEKQFEDALKKIIGEENTDTFKLIILKRAKKFSSNGDNVYWCFTKNGNSPAIMKFAYYYWNWYQNRGPYQITQEANSGDSILDFTVISTPGWGDWPCWCFTKNGNSPAIMKFAYYYRVLSSSDPTTGGPYQITQEASSGDSILDFVIVGRWDRVAYWCFAENNGPEVKFAYYYRVLTTSSPTSLPYQITQESSSGDSILDFTVIYDWDKGDDLVYWCFAENNGPEVKFAYYYRVLSSSDPTTGGPYQITQEASSGDSILDFTVIDDWDEREALAYWCFAENNGPEVKFAYYYRVLTTSAPTGLPYQITQEASSGDSILHFKVIDGWAFWCFTENGESLLMEFAYYYRVLTTSDPTDLPYQITQEAHSSDSILDFTVIGSIAHWCFIHSNEAAYYYSCLTLTGPKAGFRRITEEARSGDSIKNFQVIGLRASWRFCRSTGCKDHELTLSCSEVTLANSAWPCFGYDNRNTRQSPYLGPQDGMIKWHNFGMGSSDSPVIGPNNTLYVGSGGYLYALDAETGDVKWSKEGSSGFSPAIGSNGIVYVVNGAFICALDAETGDLKWHTKRLGGEVTSSPTIANGVIYIACKKVDSYNHVIYALDGETGRVIWEYPITGQGSPEYALALSSDGLLYFGSGYYIYALDGETGLEIWKKNLGWVVKSPVIGPDGRVYVGRTYAFGGGEVYALAGLTGQVLWKSPIIDANEDGSRNKTFSFSALGADGTVYIGGDDNIYALDGATGKIKWRYEKNGRYEITGYSSSPAIGSDGTVYIGSGTRFYALDGSTGDLKWDFGTGGQTSPPAIGSDGTVYFGSGGILYAFTQKEDGTIEMAPGLAKGGWPRTGYNNQNTRRSPYIGSQTNTLRWKYQVGQKLYYPPVIGIDGTVYVIADSDENTYLYAIDGKNKTVEWEFRFEGKLFSPPIIRADGAIYVTEGYLNEQHYYSDTYLYTLDKADGSIKQRNKILGTSTVPLAITADGTVYIPGARYSHARGSLYAVSGVNGKIKWISSGYLLTGMISDPAVGADGSIYLGYGPLEIGDKYGLLIALDGKHGDKKWSFRSGAGVSDVVIGPDETIYALILDFTGHPLSSNYTVTETIYALDKEKGDLKWQKSIEANLGRLAISPDGTLYCGDTEGNVYALEGEDREFELLYKTTGLISYTPTLGADNTIYIGSEGGYLYAIDGENGGLKWQYEIGENMMPPVIGTYGTVYVATKDGYLYAFGLQNSENECQQNNECSEDQYCMKAEGDCDGLGVCSTRSPICTMEYNPVCGCDGVNYSSPCQAAQNGVSVDYPGSCKECSGGIPEVLFQDEFNDNSKWFEGNDDSYLLNIENGKYVFENKRTDQSWFTAKSLEIDQDNFTIESTMKKISGQDTKRYSMIWGLSSNNGHYDFYYFGVYGNGKYGYGRHVNDKWIDVIEPTETFCINKYNVTNKLTIIKLGNTLQFFINDHYVDEAPFEAFFDNYLGWDIDVGLKVEIDNLIIKSLPENGCTDKEYCKTEERDCEGIGICSKRPQECPREYEPVCGCDGKTYSNVCNAARSGANVDYVGECSQECTYTISPESKSFASSGGSGSIDVTTQSGCPLNPVSDSLWIIITSFTRRGNGSVNYQVSTNPGPGGRTGTITIGRKTFVVYQDEYRDSDGDQINDNEDNCPNVANPSQEDFDGDQEGDACDCNDKFWGPNEEAADCGGNCMVSCADGCKPVIIKGDPACKKDVVFIQSDEEEWAGKSLREIILDIIYESYYRDDILALNKDKINFWYSKQKLSIDISRDNCGWHEVNDQSEFDQYYGECPYTDIGAILHIKGCRDYYHWGYRIFSSIYNAYMICLHESGHALFGLADEYDDEPSGCGNLYFQPSPYPNIFDLEEVCRSDTYNLGSCRNFTQCNGGNDTNNDGWWTAQPEDSMMACGCEDFHKRGEDIIEICPWGADAERQIQYVFDVELEKQCRGQPVDVMRKAIVGTFSYSGGIFTMQKADIVYGDSPNRTHTSDGLKMVFKDSYKNLINMFTINDPRYIEYPYPPGGKLLDHTDFTMVFPFLDNIKTLEVYYTESNELLASIDLSSTIIEFCIYNMYDPQCSIYDSNGDGVPDFEEEIGPHPPGTPSPLSPSDGTTVRTLTPRLSCTSVIDPDGDQVVYVFRLATDQDVLAHNILSSDNDWSFSPTITIPEGILSPNTTYYWAVYTHDWENGSGMSQVSHFTTAPEYTIICYSRYGR